MDENMAKKHNLAVMVVSLVLVEGLAIYLNMVAHPKQQPMLTIIIVLVIAAIAGTKKLEICALEHGKSGLCPLIK